MKPLLLALGLSLSGTAICAQDLYVGGGVDYQLPHSGDAQTSTALYAGAAFGEGLLGYGVEAEYGTAVTDGTTYDAARVRARATYNFGSVIGSASAGFTQYSQDGDDFTGTNFGVGAELPYSDNASLRLELIRDLMDDFGNNVTTTRAGVVFNF